MSKAIAIFTGGITELRQAALNEVGDIFTRGQNHNRYGYSWSSWNYVGKASSLDIMEVQCGFCTLRKAKPNDAYINNRSLFDKNGKIRVRLPY